ncbi:5-formyltetrahydrofolate cyclo-ligase [Marinobacter alexandrii]|uniref:5-formyltetrahydrofolate cyclo-ligase n=1 Tax=Marinobacter alexandrii TaxID=2570351 RepID=UPI00329A5FEE
MSAITQHKARLRQQLRQQRQRLSTIEREAAASMIAGHSLALPNWAQIRSVAVYSANDGEADPLPLATRALGQGRHLFLPVIQADNSLRFARWEPGDNLVNNKYGIGEPEPHIQRVSADTIDLICMPTVGWSHDGTRLGMGGGFYDRTLETSSGATTLGLGFECQHCDEIPREPWDACLQWVATEANLHQCSSDGVIR